jgi:uncharacterized integral membrane protein
MNENEPTPEPTPSSETVDAKSPGGEPEEAWQPQLWSKIILLIVVVGYGIALIVANSGKVDISFLFYSIKTSAIVLILVCFAVGLISGVLISQVHRHRKNARARLEWQAEQSKK